MAACSSHLLAGRPAWDVARNDLAPAMYTTVLFTAMTSGIAAGLLASEWQKGTGWWGVGVVGCMMMGVCCWNLPALLPCSLTLLIPPYPRSLPSSTTVWLLFARIYRPDRAPLPGQKSQQLQVGSGKQQAVPYLPVSEPTHEEEGHSMGCEDGKDASMLGMVVSWVTLLAVVISIPILIKHSGK